MFLTFIYFHTDKIQEDRNMVVWVIVYKTFKNIFLQHFYIRGSPATLIAV